jgi:hypothetical protein
MPILTARILTIIPNYEKSITEYHVPEPAEGLKNFMMQATGLGAG